MPDRRLPDNGLTGTVNSSLRRIAVVLAALFIAVAAGCSSGSSPYTFKTVAKSDTDMVSDLYLAEMTRLIEELAVKLYRRNPRELAKAPVHPVTIEERINQIISCRNPDTREAMAELDERRGIDAMLLGFEPDYPGDRVFAVVFGLYSMILTSYNDTCEFFLLSSLDQQKLYNSARNIEILVWRLKTRQTNDGRPLLLTNETGEAARNLSFERLFGKMIALQDMMALIVADKTNRFINRAIHMAAGMTFFPL